MYLLSNIQDRNYWEDYSDMDDVIFDITDKELKNKKHSEWFSIEKGSIVCVLMSTRKVSTFFRVNEVVKMDIVDSEKGHQYILRGDVVAKSDDREDITRLLNKFDIKHKNLPKNRIGIGFKVADIGNALDEIVVKAADGSSLKLGEL